MVTAVIALGVRNTVGFNNVLNVVNLVVWVFMIIAGLFFISSSNWEGGKFLPYGWSGVRNCFAKGALSTNFQLPIKRLYSFLEDGCLSLNVLLYLSKWSSFSPVSPIAWSQETV